MTEEFKKQIETEARQAVTELLAQAKLKKGDVFVVGCSSSEIVGGHIGKDSSLEAAQAVYAGVAPTGSLFIDMPQFVTSGSPERRAMFPMFAVPTPIVRQRNPRWPDALTLMCLWARLSIITCLMRLVGGCRPTDLYDLKVHTYEPRDDGQDLPRVCRGACRARAGSRRWQRERLCGRAGRLAVRNGCPLRCDQSRAC